MFRRIVISLAWYGASIVLAPSVHAQLSTVIQRSTRARDSASIIAAFAKADTGRMMRPNREMSAYTTPSLCLAAVERLENLRWRMELIDTLQRFTAGDTMSTAARKIGRSCIASMAPKSVTSIQLPILMKLAVRVGDTAKARAVVDYQLSVAPDSRTRGGILRDFLATLHVARPKQVGLIQEYFKRFDPSDVDGALAWVLGSTYIRDIAWTRYDLDAIMQIDLEREKVLETIPQEVRYKYRLPLKQYLLDSIEIVKYKRTPDLPSVTARLVEEAMMEAPPEMRAAAIASSEMEASIVGKPFRELSGSEWFPDSVTRQWFLGKVTFVVFVRNRGDGTLIEDMARYRRLYEQYKGRGFQVILVVGTRGFAWESRPLEPAEEAKAIGWFYRERLKLPFRVVVQNTSFQRIPDGRRVSDQNLFEQQYADVSNFVTTFLVGRDGNVLRFKPDALSDVGLDVWIKMALDESGK